MEIKTKMNPENITREDLEAFEEVRRSGKTNMFAANVVALLSGLTKRQVICIITNYGFLCKKFPNARVDWNSVVKGLIDKQISWKREEENNP